MDVSPVLHWAWPRNGAAPQGMNWRELLHQAVGQKLGQEPTVAHIFYRSENQPVDNASCWCTTVKLTIGDTDYRFTGVPQCSQVLAIRCAAWRALMEMCTAGLLEAPVF